MRSLPMLITLSSIALAAFAAPAAAKPAPAKPGKSLYKRLGGKPKLDALVSSFVDRVSQDPRLLANPSIATLNQKTNKPALKTKLSTQLCEATGGPCKAKALSLGKGVPEPQLTPRDWLYLIQDANQSLEEAKIPKPEQGELMNLLLKNTQK